MRKNQMIMMDEFRRRKSLKDYHEGMTQEDRKATADMRWESATPFDMHKESNENIMQYKGSNEERYFEPQRDEIFDPGDFTVVFMASDSVTNVTSLNRVNQRRVLIFIGNGNGLISYGKGKAGEYEGAFDNAFKKARQNMVCLHLEEIFTTPYSL